MRNIVIYGGEILLFLVAFVKVFWPDLVAELSWTELFLCFVISYQFRILDGQRELLKLIERSCR